MEESKINKQQHESGKRGLSIRIKLIGLIVISVLTILGVSFFAYSFGEKHSDSFEEYQEDHVKPQLTLANIKTKLSGVQANIALLSGDGSIYRINIVEQTISKNSKIIDNNLQDYKIHIQSPKEEALFDELSFRVSQTFNYANRLIDTLRIIDAKSKSFLEIKNKDDDKEENEDKKKLTNKSIRAKFELKKRKLAQFYITKYITPNIETAFTSIDNINEFKEESSDKLIAIQKEELVEIKLIYVIVGLLGIFLMVVFGTIIIGRVNLSVKKIGRKILDLKRGKVENLDNTTVSGNDEMGQISQGLSLVQTNIKLAAEFAGAIGEGEFENRFAPLSEDDLLGKALSEMRDQLKHVAVEEQKRNWVISGLAKFSSILRANDDLKQLSDNIISNIVKYVNANQGAIYVLNDDDEKNPFLEMVSAYAYNRKKFIDEGFSLGEGLVGQAAIEKDTIYIDEIPEDYSTISSGLGEAKPRCLLIVPIIYNENLYGVLEFGSFHKFLNHEIEFIQKLSGNIGASLATVKANQKTLKLLNAAQELGQELQEQQKILEQKAKESQDAQAQIQRQFVESSGQLNAMNNAAIVLEFDDKGEIGFVNDAFCDLTKYKLRELITKPVSIVHSNFHSEDFYKEQWKTISKGKVWRNEVKYKAKDGSHFWLINTITPVLGTNDKPKKYISVAFDITKQKEQEEQIQKALEHSRAQEEELRQNAEELMATQEEMTRTQRELKTRIDIINSSTLVSETDLDGTITFINDEFCRISQFDSNELLGQHYDFLRHPDEPKDTNDDIWATIATGKIWHGELLNRKKDGSKFWSVATIGPVLNLKGKPIKFITVLVDLTKQKQQEQNLQTALEGAKAQEEELRQNTEELMATQEEMMRAQKEIQARDKVLNNSSLVIELDTDFKISFANDLFLSTLSYEHSELIGQTFEKYLTTPELLENGKSIILKGGVWQSEMQLIANDESEFWVKVSFASVFSNNGVPIKYIGIFTDINVIKSQEETLRATLGTLQSKEEELRKFNEEISFQKQELQDAFNQISSQKEQFKAITYNIPDIVYQFILKPNGEYQFNFISDRVTDILGYSPDEIVADFDKNFKIDSNNKQAFQYALSESAFSMDDFLWEGKVYTKDEKIVWLRASAKPSRDEKENIVWDGILAEVTKQKKNEQNLKQALEESLAKEENLRQSQKGELTIEEILKNQYRDKIIQQKSLLMELDTEFRIQHFNESLLEKLGFTLKEILKKPFANLLQDTNLIVNAKTFLDQGEIWEKDFVLRGKRKKQIWIRAKFTAVKDEDGRILTYFGICEDISELKSKANLRETTDYKEYLNQIDTFLIKLNHRGEILFHNNTFRTFTEEVELVGKKLWNINIFKDTEKLNSRLQKAIEKVTAGRNVSFKERIVSAGKEIYLNFKLKSVISISGTLKYILLEISDITSLESSSSQLQSLVSNMNTSDKHQKIRNKVINSGNWVLELDENSKVKYANDKAIAELGYTDEELKSMHICDVFVNQNDCMNSKTIVDGGDLWTGIHQIKTKNDEMIWLKVTAAAVFDEKDETKIKKYVHVYTNISEIKTKELQLEQNLQELSQKLSAYKKIDLITAELDADVNLMVANEIFYKLSGYSEDEIFATPLSQLLSDENQQNIIDSLKSGNSWHGIINLKAKNEARLWFDANIQAHKDENGTVKKYSLIAGDISQNKINELIVNNLQAQLSESEVYTQIQAILEQSKQGKNL